MMALTSKQTAAQAQIDHVSWSGGKGIVTYADDCTLTDAQKLSIADMMISGVKAVDVIASVMDGVISVEQRLAALE
jgi:hypothetical protein